MADSALNMVGRSNGNNDPAATATQLSLPAMAPAAATAGTVDKSESDTQLFDISTSPPDRKRRGRSETSQPIPDVTTLATGRPAARPRTGTPQQLGRRRGRTTQGVDWGQMARAVHRRIDAGPNPSNFERQVKEAIEDILDLLGQHTDQLKELDDGAAEMAKLELQARQRHAVMKTELADVQAHLDEAKQDIHRLKDVVTRHEGHEAEIQQDINRLKGVVTRHEEHESEVQQYITALDGERPREGQAVMAAFKHLANDVDLLKKQTASGLNRVAGATISPQDSERVNAMEAKVHALYQQHENGVLQSLYGVVEQQAQRIAHLECADTRPAEAPGLHAAPCEPCNSGFAGTGQEWCGGHYHPTGPPPAGQAGSSGDGLPPYVARSQGGNGLCHCVHVEQLDARVRFIEQRPHGGGGGAGHHGGPAGQRPPFLPGAREPQQGAPRADRTVLKPVGPLGLLATDKQLFDDKLTDRAEYRFDGAKVDGVAWKSKLERYFMSKVPALLQILEWTEGQDQAEVTEDMLSAALNSVHSDMSLHQQQTLNASIWGFLSGCLSGPAETMFKRAKKLNGLDAWRRVIRVIDKGLPLRLEELRAEVRVLHTKKIKDLESVATGIAEFEAKIAEYTDAGGTGFGGDSEMKSDLLAILPERLREDLLWNASEPRPYIEFRDMVSTQAARILFNRRRAGIHGVDEPPEPRERPQEDQGHAGGLGQITSVEELIAAINRMGAARADNRSRPAARERDRSRAPPRSAANERSHKCPNCSQEHDAVRCPHPAVAISDRKCWTCGEKNHTSRNCPKKKSLKAIEDGGMSMPSFGGVIATVVDTEGFQLARRTCRPMPRGAILGDFVIPVKNSFKKLSIEAENNERSSTGHAKATSPPTTTSARATFPEISSSSSPSTATSSSTSRTPATARPRATTASTSPSAATSSSSSTATSSTTSRTSTTRTPSAGPAPASAAAEERRAAREWEAMKANSPEARAEMRRREAQAQVPAMTSDVGSRARSRVPADDGSVAETSRAAQPSTTARIEEFCHACGQISVCSIPQKCPRCGCRNAMSIADAEARAWATSRGTLDAKHPAAVQPRRRPLLTADDEETVREIRGGIMDINSDSNGNPDGDKLHLIVEEDEDILATANATEVRIRPAMDSGAVANVIHPADLPAGVVPSGNPQGKHFVGANNSEIKRYGHCNTVLKGEALLKDVTCGWQVAEVTRPLNSVSQVCGPPEGRGEQDVLFNNRKCVVVPPGIVDEILKKVTPVAQYDREGGLYLADLVVSGFARQGAGR